MRTRFFLALIFTLSTVLFTASFAAATLIDSSVEGGVLSGSPDYEWWYGCSPTAAGMMMGYYDIHGYGGLSYSNLVPGGVAELSSFGTPGALANQIIASSGHINDFYRGLYGVSGDDVSAPFHSFNSLADFMGTSQDSLGNTNGSTTFYNYTNGAKLYYTDIVRYGLTAKSGMYGIYEYITYAGYGVSSLYNQYTDNVGKSYGFTLADFRNEIDNKRLVLLHVEGHTLFGYGYQGNTIDVYDTWDPGAHTMTWGQSYEGLGLYAVTVLELAGGSTIPEPGSAVLFGSGVIMVAFFRQRRTRSGACQFD